MFNRLNNVEHVAWVHLLSEFFSTMTGPGIEVKEQQGQPARFILAADDAAKWLRTFAAKVVVVDLTAEARISCAPLAGPLCFQPA